MQPLPSSFSDAACAAESDSRATSVARSSPYRSAKISPWHCPWSESTTMWYFRGATAATASSLGEHGVDAGQCVERLGLA